MRKTWTVEDKLGGWGVAQDKFFAGKARCRLYLMSRVEVRVVTLDLGFAVPGRLAQHKGGASPCAWTSGFYGMQAGWSEHGAGRGLCCEGDSIMCLACCEVKETALTPSARVGGGDFSYSQGAGK